MNQEVILLQLRQIINTNFGVPLEHITPESSFRANLGMDSLDLVDLIFFVGKNFAVDKPVEAYHELVTVQELASFIYVQLEEAKDS